MKINKIKKVAGISLATGAVIAAGAFGLSNTNAFAQSEDSTPAPAPVAATQPAAEVSTPSEPVTNDKLALAKAIKTAKEEIANNGDDNDVWAPKGSIGADFKLDSDTQAVLEAEAKRTGRAVSITGPNQYDNGIFIDENGRFWLNDPTGQAKPNNTLSASN